MLIVSALIGSSFAELVDLQGFAPKRITEGAFIEAVYDQSAQRRGWGHTPTTQLVDMRVN